MPVSDVILRGAGPFCTRNPDAGRSKVTKLEADPRLRCREQHFNRVERDLESLTPNKDHVYIFQNLADGPL